VCEFNDGWARASTASFSIKCWNPILNIHAYEYNICTKFSVSFVPCRMYIAFRRRVSCILREGIIKILETSLPEFWN
jgi:hypothetical protein